MKRILSTFMTIASLTMTFALTSEAACKRPTSVLLKFDGDHAGFVTRSKRLMITIVNANAQFDTRGHFVRIENLSARYTFRVTSKRARFKSIVIEPGRTFVVFAGRLGKKFSPNIDVSFIECND